MGVMAIQRFAHWPVPPATRYFVSSWVLAAMLVSTCQREQVISFAAEQRTLFTSLAAVPPIAKLMSE